MRALIFANGELDPETEIPPPADYDLIIAADGGSDHCQRLDILPHFLIGDLDSNSQLLLEKWKDEGVEIIRHPQRKDKTDLEIALEFAQEKGAQEIDVYGALGARLDMTLANVLLLAHPSLECSIRLFRKEQRMTVIRGGEEATLAGQPGETVSLVPLRPGTYGITTEDLEYPLRGEALAYGTSRGISNVMTANQARISLKEGLLCIIHTKNTS